MNVVDQPPRKDQQQAIGKHQIVMGELAGVAGAMWIEKAQTAGRGRVIRLTAVHHIQALPVRGITDTGRQVLPVAKHLMPSPHRPRHVFGHSLLLTDLCHPPLHQSPQCLHRGMGAGEEVQGLWCRIQQHTQLPAKGWLPDGLIKKHRGWKEMTTLHG